jgi:hypothetical protein
MARKIDNTFDAVMVLEQDEDPTQDDGVRALQKLINDGQAWKFQGAYGRAMMDAIERGVCALGPKPASDYYGNRIPSRFEVKPGTKGSVEFVKANGNEVME